MSLHEACQAQGSAFGTATGRLGMRNGVNIHMECAHGCVLSAYADIVLFGQSPEAFDIADGRKVQYFSDGVPAIALSRLCLRSGVEAGVHISMSLHGSRHPSSPSRQRDAALPQSTSASHATKGASHRAADATERFSG